MHCGAALRHQTGDDPACRVLREECSSDLPDGLMGGALPHTDQNDAFSDRHDIATFQARCPELLVHISPPNGETPAPKHGMEFVHGTLKQGLWIPSRPIHGVDSDAAVNPARRVTLEQRVWDWR